MLALGRIVEAVEEGALLGEQQAGPASSARNSTVVSETEMRRSFEQEVVGEDDPLVLDDVVEACCGTRATGRRGERLPLTSPPPTRKSSSQIGVGPARRVGEPLALQLGVGRTR